MNRTGLVAEIARKTGVPAVTVDKVIGGFVSAVADGLKNDGAVFIRDFGRFTLKEIKEREIKSPTGETCRIYAQKIPRFTPSAGFTSKSDPA